MPESANFELSLRFKTNIDQTFKVSKNAGEAYLFLVSAINLAHDTELPILYDVVKNRTMAHAVISTAHGFKAIQITLGLEPEDFFPKYETSLLHELAHIHLQAQGISFLKNTVDEDRERCLAVADLAENPAIFDLFNTYNLKWDTHFDLGRVQSDFADTKRVKRSEAFEKHPFNIARRYADLYFINPEIYAYILKTLPELVNGNKVLELLTVVNKHRDELGKKIRTVDGVKEIKARLLEEWKFPYESIVNFPAQK